MQKEKRLRAICMALLFLIGALVFTIPLLREWNAYRTDEAEYEAIAVQYRPPESNQAPAIPLWKQTGAPDEAVAEIVPTSAPMPGETDPLDSSPVPDVETTVSPNQSPEPIEGTETIAPVSQPTTGPDQPIIQPGIDLEACLEQNKDFVAWLSIPDTKISYPVVRSDNSEYYLHHLFSGKESKLGTLFSLNSSDYQTPSRNIAIYGHHLSQSDAMFSTLIRYKDQTYCEAHSRICLDSLYGTREYTIFAVLNMHVNDWDAATAAFPSEKDFLRFVSRAQKKALYDTDVHVEEGDNILTLITCDRSYGGASGRLIVMAVQQ